MKTAIMVIDTLNDFFPGGALPVEGAFRICPHVKDLAIRARNQNCPVIFVQDWHEQNDPEFQLYPPHCVKGTPGAECLPELADVQSQAQYIIRKQTTNVFQDPAVPGLLRGLGVKRLVLCGLAFDVCVREAAESAKCAGWETIVAMDATAALTNTGYNQTFEALSFLGVQLRFTCSL